MPQTLRYATVKATSPLTILMDGDDPADMSVRIPAQLASGYTPTVNDRVRVEIKPNGLLPVVCFKVT